ncbi:MAG TPA: ABC-F type ribosomal protection protein [Bacilli bacterium]|nr:ABC-F type ribosomal protection protein [Bacilli bacterium]
MYALKLLDVKKMFANRTVFEDVTAGIEYGEKVGIVGPNGVGKTTLLRILTGELQPDGGKVQWDKNLSREQVGLMTQQAQFEQGETVREFVRRAKGELVQVEVEMAALEARMGSFGDSANDKRNRNEPAEDQDAQVGDPARVQQLVEQAEGVQELVPLLKEQMSLGMEALLAAYGTLQARFEALGGYTHDSEVERALLDVGLGEEVWHTPFAEASGGQKTRAQLARLWLQEPRVLLLDEPTNHLDAATMDWLEERIHAFSGTVVTVSHDRYFLDRVATRILEVRADGIGSYPGNYTAYVEAKERERRTQQATYDRQQVEMKHLQETIDMYRGWFQQAHKAAGQQDFLRAKSKKHVSRLHNKERQLERLQENAVDRPKESLTIEVSFAGEGRMSHRIFSVENVAVRFGERELYRGVNFVVERGERMALVGPNGIGKSTLLKVLTGELQPSEGLVKSNPQVRIGYFGQEVDRLDAQKTVLQEVLSIDGLKQSEARTVLACFLFRGEDVFKRVGSLSQGEKCRVAFVKLYFSGANVLVLDEPTNYLDISARERIEEALLNFPGTLLLVSHDRYMVQRLATQLLLFEAGDVEKGKSGQVMHFAGSWSEWMETQVLRNTPPEDRQRAEQRMILQMELSTLADRLTDGHVPEDVSERIMEEMTQVQERLIKLMKG